MWPVRPSNSTRPRETQLQRPARLPHPRAPPEAGGAAPRTPPHSQQEQRSYLNPNCFWSLDRGEEARRGAGNQQHEVQESPDFLAVEKSAPHPLVASLHPKDKTTGVSKQQSYGELKDFVVPG